MTYTVSQGKLPSFIAGLITGKIDVRYDCKDERFKLRKYMDEREINLAFDMYKEARKGYIVSLAEKYKEYLDPRAYSTLLSYEIEIDD